jgi:hypothetical protein
MSLALARWSRRVITLRPVLRIFRKKEVRPFREGRKLGSLIFN